jgi:hypothetical protein
LAPFSAWSYPPLHRIMHLCRTRPCGDVRHIQPLARTVEICHSREGRKPDPANPSFPRTRESTSRLHWTLAFADRVRSTRGARAPRARLGVGLWVLHCGAPALRSGVPCAPRNRGDATGRFCAWALNAPCAKSLLRLSAGADRPSISAVLGAAEAHPQPHPQPCSLHRWYASEESTPTTASFPRTRKSRPPYSVIPANAGIHFTPAWIPAFAGMTEWRGCVPAFAGMTKWQGLVSCLRGNDGVKGLDSRVRGNDGRGRLRSVAPQSNARAQISCAGMTGGVAG